MTATKLSYTSGISRWAGTWSQNVIGRRGKRWHSNFALVLSVAQQRPSVGVRVLYRAQRLVVDPRLQGRDGSIYEGISELAYQRVELGLSEAGFGAAS